MSDGFIGLGDALRAQAEAQARANEKAKVGPLCNEVARLISEVQRLSKLVSELRATVYGTSEGR